MKELNLNQEERTFVSRLSDCLGLNLPEADLKKVEPVKTVLRQAWQRSDEKLHNWGVARLRISSLASRLSGFNRYTLKRRSSIQNALML